MANEVGIEVLGQKVARLGVADVAVGAADAVLQHFGVAPCGQHVRVVVGLHHQVRGLVNLGGYFVGEVADVGGYDQPHGAAAAAAYQETLRDSLKNFIDDFNKDGRYTMILSKSGDNILYADKQLDITDQVVAGLNKRYKK